MSSCSKRMERSLLISSCKPSRMLQRRRSNDPLEVTAEEERVEHAMMTIDDENNRLGFLPQSGTEGSLLPPQLRPRHARMR